VINVGGEWYYEEYGPGRGVRGLGLNDPWPGMPDVGMPGAEGDEPLPVPIPSDVRRGILDMFRN
jgi:penicillin-binding protein 1A